MGNLVPKKSTGSPAAVSGGNKHRINLDDVDLTQIDASVTAAKDDKKIRKTKEYKTLRSAARTGIEAHRRFQLWQKAANAKTEYNTMYDNICNDLFSDINMDDFPQFPRFGSACSFKKLSTSLLLHSSQRILLVLAIEHDSLKYCPQLGYLVELMLTVQNATESSVFSICHSMLVASKKNNWYFRTDYFNSYIRIKTFLSIFEDNVTFVASYLKQNNMDISNMLGDAISSMFVEYLNNETYLRLVDTFTVEGYKILFRVGVAILNYAQSKLILCKDLTKLKEVLISESRKLTPDELCTRCFKIYLTRNKFDKLDQFHRNKGFDDNLYNKIEEETYVRRWPTWDKSIMNKSSILTLKVQFIQLWVWLPPGSHIGDYSLLFSTANHGYKLSELYKQCQNKENLIIIMKTTKSEIIGVFVTNFQDPNDMDKWAPLTKRIKDPKVLLFQLHAIADNNIANNVNANDTSNDNDNDNNVDANAINNSVNDNDDDNDDNNVNNNDNNDDDDDNAVNNDNKQNDDDPDNPIEFEPKCYYAKNADNYYHASSFQLKNLHTQRDQTIDDIVSDLKDNKDNNDDNNDNDNDLGQEIPIVFPSKDSLMVGDRNDNCLFIDDALNYGFSSASKTFNSPSLVIEKDGQFQISEVEVWCVD